MLKLHSKLSEEVTMAGQKRLLFCLWTLLYILDMSLLLELIGNICIRRFSRRQNTLDIELDPDMTTFHFPVLSHYAERGVIEMN